MRIFAFSIKHESNSFAGRLTPLDDFLVGGGLLRGEAASTHFAGTNSEWGGLLAAAGRHGWTLVSSVAASATPSGRVEDDAVRTMADAVLADLAGAGAVDAVFAMLHGAMQSAARDDVEGWLLGRLREAVGPNVPIAVTLDPHANVSRAMIDAADLLVPYRTTPHVDQADTARRCADLRAEVFARQARPRLVWCQPPQNDLDDGRTNRPDAPMARLLREADAAVAADGGLAAVSLFGGFPWGDIETCGPSVVVMDWRDDLAAARALAIGLARRMWEARDETTLPFFDLATALGRIATEPRQGPGPIILVDYADCPAGGSPGDNVSLLRELFDLGGQGFAYGICDDAEVAAQAWAAGEGAVVDIVLGGKKDPAFSGQPLAARARVLRLTDGNFVRTGPVGTGTPGRMGPCALLDIDGVRVAVASRPMAIEDRSQLRHFGIEPDTEARLLLKAMNHFRADFDTIAGAYLYLDSPALCSHDWSLFDYVRIRRPVHPFDTGFEPAEDFAVYSPPAGG